LINEVAVDGGYILDAGAIMQDDTSIENMRVMTEYVHEHGRYSRTVAAPEPKPFTGALDPRLEKVGKRPAESVIPWAEEKAEMPEIVGDEELVKRTVGAFDSCGVRSFGEVKGGWKCRTRFALPGD
jgi:hypothetical protein